MKKLISGLFVFVVSLMIIVMAISCSGKEKSVIQEESISTQTEVESSEVETSEESTEEITIEETTEEKTTVEETTEEELVELSSCIVLPESFCGEGEPLCGFEEVLPIGFNLPPGTEIRSPFNGLLTIPDLLLDDGKTIVKAISITRWPPVEEVLTTFCFWDVIPEETLQENETVDFKWGETAKGDIMEEIIVVEKGEVIGQTTSEIFGDWGDNKKYNLLIWIDVTKDLPPYRDDYFPEYYVDMEFVREFFPYIQCEGEE